MSKERAAEGAYLKQSVANSANKLAVREQTREAGQNDKEGTQRERIAAKESAPKTQIPIIS